MVSSILLFLSLVFLAYLLGTKLLSFLGYEKEDFFSSIGLGFGFFIYLVFGLGCCNLLYSSVILVILGLLFLISVIATVKEFTRADQIKSKTDTSADQKVKETGKSSGFLLKSSALFFLFILLLTNFISALFPPIAYDALEYHFAIPLFYIKSHKITALPTNVYSNLPLNIEILYTLGLLIKDDVVAKLIHFLFAIITAGLLFSIGKKYLSVEVGLFSAVSFLSFPITLILNLQGNVDFGIAGFSALAIYTFLTWLENKQTKDLILSAIFSGLALGSKITGFVIIMLPLFIMIFYESIHTHKNKITAEQMTSPNPFYYPFIFISVCFSLFLIWLLKNLIFTGNPVFPFLYKFLDGYNWNFTAYTKFSQAHSAFFKLSDLWQKPLELISVPASKYCFAPIIFFPLLWLARNQIMKNKSIKYLLLLTFLGYCGWFFFTHRVDRFLLPVAIPVCLIGSYAVFYKFKKSKFLKYLATSIFLIGIFYNTLFQIRNSISLGNPFSANTREKFLETFLTTYPIIKYINSHLPNSAKILFIAEARGYYLERPVLLNTVFDKIIILEIAKQSVTPEDILSHLKELKITHIFYNPYELNRLEEFYGAYFDWEKHPREYQLLSLFWNKYLEKVASYGKMELLKIKYY